MPKKKKTTISRSRYANSSKLEILLAKTKISNVTLRYFRKRKSGNKSAKLKSQSQNILFSKFTYALTFRKNLVLKMVIVIIVAIVAYVGISFYRQYNSIEFTPYLRDPTEEQVDVGYVGPEYNILLTGFQKISNNRFAQSILLLSLNSKTGNLRILAINPNYITSAPQSNKKYTVKSLINNLDSEDPAYEYSESIENLIGVRVDRYIAYDIDKFKNLVVDWDLSMKSIDPFNSSVGFFTKDSNINKNALVEYLFDVDASQNYDLLLNRQISFLSQFLQGNRNILFYLKVFWSADKFTQIFHTNMTKQEMSGFLNNLMNSDLPARTAVIDSTVGIKSSTGTEEGLVPNYLEFDNKVKDTMLNIDIVKEQVNIEVYNASSVPGYASRVKRIFENMGGNIINANNYPEKVKGIKLYVPNKNSEKYPNNISAIESYFGKDLEIIIGEYKYNHTADLILVLGEK